MKYFTRLILLALILFPVLTTATELVVLTWRIYDFPGHHNQRLIDSWDTDSDVMTRGELSPQQLVTRRGMMAMAPDNSVYYLLCEEFLPLPGTIGAVCLPQIMRIALSMDADGNISQGPAQQMYISAEPISSDDYYHNLLISDIAIRQLDDESGYRVYFSTGGCGACEAAARIYYLDDAGNPQLYYEIPRNDITGSCSGMIGFWSGNFDFDDEGELYLSSGNHNPSALFHVPGASADTVAGTPTQIYEVPGGLLNFVVDSNQEIYFETSGWDRFVYKVNMETHEISEALEFTVDELAPPVGPEPAARVFDLDKMVPFPAQISGHRRLMRAPSVADRARALPASDTSIRGRSPQTVMLGSLVDRLPSAPSPDSPAQPTDLKIVGLEAGKASVSNHQVQLPLRVFVRNTGQTTNTPFEVSVQAVFAGRKETQMASFKVSGQNNQSRPTLQKLAPNAVMAVGGVVSLQVPAGWSMKKQPITLIAEVDSCRAPDGKRTGKPGCRVKEHNEKNNRMKLLLEL